MRIRTALALTLAFFMSAAGASVRAQAQTARAQQNDTRTVGPVVAATAAQNTGTRSRVFELKHRQPEALVRALRPLGSRESEWTWSTELRTITVRDFPENLASIEEAIQRLDRREPAQQGIEFHIHVLIASANATSSKPLPAELNDVIKQLQTTLSYKNYSLMTSDVLRGQVGPGTISNKGVSELRLSPDMAASSNPIFYEYNLAMTSVEPSSSGPAKIEVAGFAFNMRIPLAATSGNLQYENIGFKTPVSVREGEKVVVGTTSMQDKGLVIVITANTIK
ncbi:MAG TPA: secretin N-terminal domain-containing protein [Pyrinomonadaceae bacterium]|nr:secretin N-terminal domain-containing protein [Pyrinomonadaceae bacterium]